MSNANGYIHFYMSDGDYAQVECSTEEAQKYIEILGRGQNPAITDSDGKRLWLNEKHVTRVEFHPHKTKETP